MPLGILFIIVFIIIIIIVLYSDYAEANRKDFVPNSAWDTFKMYFSFQQTQSAELVPEILCQNSSLSFDLFLRQFTLLLLLLLAVSLLSRPKYLRFFKSQHVWAIFFFATQENNMNFTTIIIIMVDFFFFVCLSLRFGWYNAFIYL